MTHSPYIDASVSLTHSESPWADDDDELAIEEAMMTFGLDDDDDIFGDDDDDDDDEDLDLPLDDDDLFEDDDIDLSLDAGFIMGADDNLDDDLDDDFGDDDLDDDDLDDDFGDDDLDDDESDEGEFGYSLGGRSRYLRQSRIYLKVYRRWVRRVNRGGPLGKRGLGQKRMGRVLNRLNRLWRNLSSRQKAGLSDPNAVRARAISMYGRPSRPSSRSGRPPKRAPGLSPAQAALIRAQASQTNHARRAEGGGRVISPALRAARQRARLSQLSTPRLRQLARNSPSAQVRRIARVILKSRGASLASRRVHQGPGAPIVPPQPAPRATTAQDIFRARLAHTMVPHRRPRRVVRIPRLVTPTPAPVGIPKIRVPGMRGGGYGAEPVGGAELAPVMQVPPGYELTPTFWGALSTTVKTHPLKSAALALGTVALAVRYSSDISGATSRVGDRLLGRY